MVIIFFNDLDTLFNATIKIDDKKNKPNEPYKTK